MLFGIFPENEKKKKTKGVVRKIEKNKNRLKVLQIIPSTLKRLKNKFQRFLRFFFSGRPMTGPGAPLALG